MKLQSQVPQVLDQDEQARIYRSALRILSQVPLTVDGTDEFNQAMSDFGCRLENRQIFFPKSVIDRVLDRIAGYKKQQDSQPRAEPGEKVIPGISGQASLTVDVDRHEIRPAMVEDVRALARFVDALGPDIAWYHPTFIPTDKPIRTREIHAFAAICLNHSKPSRVSPYSPEALKYMTEILKIALGSMDKVREHSGLVAHKLWINTPFTIGRESVEGAMLSRRLLGHKLAITMMPVSGAATPITAPGCLALITAEVLAANVITLAVDDDVIGYPSSPLTLDMKIGIHAEQDPYTDLLRLGANQMRVLLFGGPPHFGSFAPRTSAKMPGEQAMMEKTIGAMWHVICGGRTFNSVGTLGSGEVGSLVQILLDLELTGYLNRIVQGLDCEGEDRLAEAVNLRVIPQGARFMEDDHTREFYRQEQWYPQFLDRRAPQAWLKDPKTMTENARQRALEILGTAPNRCPLTESRKQQINDLLVQADRELSR